MSRIVISAKLNDRLRKAMFERGVPVGTEPEQIEQWIEANVTSLATAKVAIKMLALDILAIKTLLRSALERRSDD